MIGGARAATVLGAPLLALVALTTGCSSPSASTQCLGTYQAGVSLGAVALDYPEPSAAGVPDATRVLVLSGSAAVPIQIESVTASGAGTPVTATPVALPAPLPSPISTPIAGKGSYFAVAVPILAPDTTYRVLAATNVANVGCVGEVTQGALEVAGQFTTF